MKHVVLSLRCDWSRKAESALYCMCLEWIEKFAPGRDWVAGVHTKDGNIHCHLAVRNSGPDGRCLKFKKADLYQMVSMSWTENALPSKGTIAARTRNFVDNYLDRGLAGRTNYEAVRAWAETRVRIGEFTAGRRDKGGRLTSIVLGGVRHRLKSIARFIKTRSEESVPIAIEPGRRAIEIAEGPKTSQPVLELEPSLADFPRLRLFARKAKRKKRLRTQPGLPNL